MLNSNNKFTDDQKMLMRELFGAKGAATEENPNIGPEMNHLKDENDRLYFELRHEYDEREHNLKQIRDQMKQLQEFAQAMTSIDD